MDNEIIKQKLKESGRVKTIKYLMKSGKSIRRAKKIIDNLYLTEEEIKIQKDNAAFQRLQRKIRKLGRVLNDR